MVFILPSLREGLSLYGVRFAGPVFSVVHTIRQSLAARCYSPRAGGHLESYFRLPAGCRGICSVGSQRRGLQRLCRFLRDVSDMDHLLHLAFAMWSAILAIAAMDSTTEGPGDLGFLPFEV